MFETCLQKQKKIIDAFDLLSDEESKYDYLIKLGKESPKLEPKFKVQENIVQGCQSTMYLRSYMKDELMVFEGESDALISAGLASLLIAVYSEETPLAILKCPPDFIEKVGLAERLTPNRANGLFSIHLRMKQEALKALVKSSAD